MSGRRRRHRNRADHAHPGSPQPRPQQFPLGSREDVQMDDYVSPLTNMFSRAYARYDTAEERRGAERQLFQISQHSPETWFERTPHTDPDLLRAHNDAVNGIQAAMENLSYGSEQDMQEVENRRWGVPPPVPLVNPLHGGSIPGFRPAARRGFHAQFYGMQDYNGSSGGYANPFRPPSQARAQESVEMDGPNIIDLQRRPSPVPKEDLQVDFACKVCQEQKINTITMPCMHAAMCQFCAEVWRLRCYGPNGGFDQSQHTCVICRKQVKENRRFYTQ